MRISDWSSDVCSSVLLDYYSSVKMRIGGVRVPVMPPGDKLNMPAVNRALQDPTYFRNAFLRGFASSTGLSFEQLAKHFSDENYSATRPALPDVRADDPPVGPECVGTRSSRVSAEHVK